MIIFTARWDLIFTDFKQTSSIPPPRLNPIQNHSTIFIRHTHTRTHARTHTHTHTHSQTKMYSDTFNISQIISKCIRYSSEKGNKIWKEPRVKLFQDKFILIMSDNFDRKVCNELGWIAVSCHLLNLCKQLDNANLGQPITKQCFILFSMWCQIVALTIKEKRVTPPQNENVVIIHLPACRSNSIKALFVFGTQFKIF